MRILTLFMEQGCMYNNRMDVLFYSRVESIVVLPRENLPSGFASSSARTCVLLWELFVESKQL